METSTAAGPEELVLRRQVYTQVEFDQTYLDQTEASSTCQVLRECCRCSPRRVGRAVVGFLPVVGFLRRYRWRQWIVPDLVSGLTVGFNHFAQGLGFGILSSLKPVNGLYSSFFAIVLYMLFGTCPHVSMGTNAIIALLTANVVNREADVYAQSRGDGLTDEDIMDYKEGVSAAICFVGGVVLLGMGVLRLGFIANYFAKSFIGAFNFACAVHITTSQIVKMMHLAFQPRSGAGNLVLTYVDIAKNVTDSNPGDIIVGVVCMAVLLAVKVGINERFKDRMKYPVPIELIVIIISTLISHFAELHERFGIGVVGSVPTGMPAPSLPRLELLPRVAQDAFVIGMLCYASTVTLAKLTAKLHGYDIDDNQELVSYGMCNLVGAFFQNFPSCTAPPRAMMLSSLGARTTLNGVSSAAFILLVLLVVGQLFGALPIAMLAAMIIVAMKDLLLLIRDTKTLWHVNKMDFLIWVLTASVSVFVDLDVGLLTGVAVSIMTVVLVSQTAPGTLLGRADQEDVILEERRKATRPIPGVRIFRFESQLHFASAERFKNQLCARILDPGKKPQEVKAGSRPEHSVVLSHGLDSGKQQQQGEGGPVASPNVQLAEGVHHLVLDCSAMTYIDVTGVDMLTTVVRQFERAGVEVFLASVPPRTLSTLRRAQFFDSFDPLRVFYTVFDALHRGHKPAGVVVKM